MSPNFRRCAGPQRPSNAGPRASLKPASVETCYSSGYGAQSARGVLAEARWVEFIDENNSRARLKAGAKRASIGFRTYANHGTIATEFD
jgi:hypothetical protein